MKKTILSMALLAIIAGVVVSACSKDDANAVKNTPSVATQINNSWPQGALENCDDAYYYLRNDSEGWDSCERVESMFFVCASTAEAFNELPNNFVVLYSASAGGTRPDRPDAQGKLVLFPGVDRLTALRQLKLMSGVYAIEPVYKGKNEGTVLIPLPHVYVGLNQLSDTAEVMSYLDSRNVNCRMYNTHFSHDFWDVGVWQAEIWMDHSMLNSVAIVKLLETSGLVDYAETGAIVSFNK